MSKVFFDELEIPEPNYHLGVGSGSHGWQTGEMIKRIEEVLLKERPDVVLVYGDTNSTLAGALAASKIEYSITQSRKQPNQRRRPLVTHIEAGLRSYNRQMSEETNRVLTDQVSDILFCPTETALKNLQKEGFINILNGGKLIDTAFIASNHSRFTICSKRWRCNVRLSFISPKDSRGKSQDRQK